MEEIRPSAAFLLSSKLMFSQSYRYPSSNSIYWEGSVSTDKSAIVLDNVLRRFSKSSIFMLALVSKVALAPYQRIKQFFDFSFYLCKLHLIGGNLRVRLFLVALKQLKLPELFSHSGENKLFKLILAECAAPLTAFVVGLFGTAEVFITRRVVSRCECVPVFPTFDFPGHPSIACLAPILESDVGHQLLATSQQNVRRDTALMGNHHKDLVFQALVLVHLHSPPLIEIAAVYPGKIGGIIDHNSTLTFEKLIHSQVALCIDRVV